MLAKVKLTSELATFHELALLEIFDSLLALVDSTLFQQCFD
jgi:hypothetical protein